MSQFSSGFYHRERRGGSHDKEEIREENAETDADTTPFLIWRGKKELEDSNL